MKLDHASISPTVRIRLISIIVTFGLKTRGTTFEFTFYFMYQGCHAEAISLLNIDIELLSRH